MDIEVEEVDMPKNKVDFLTQERPLLEAGGGGTSQTVDQNPNEVEDPATRLKVTNTNTVTSTNSKTNMATNTVLATHITKTTTNTSNNTSIRGKHFIFWWPNRTLPTSLARTY